MASHKDSKDMLTCSICLETFRNPKYLPCLHTFCESCLLTYITSGFEKGNTDSIECPICRQSVEVSKENITPEKCSKELPVNFLILELLENQKIDRKDKMCMLCERLAGKVVAKAEFICIQCSDTLCETCKTYHCSMKFTSDHMIKRLDEFRKEDKMQRSLNNKCQEHPSKVLELFCTDHEIPCCSICVAIGHRKCENVQTIEEAAKGFKSSKVLQDVQEDLANVASDFESLMTSHKSSLNSLEVQYEEKRKDIGDIFENLRKTLNTQENTRKSELEKLYNVNKDEIETNLTILENRVKIIENDRNVLNVGVDNVSECQTFIEMSKIRKQLEQHKVKIDKEFPKPKTYNLVTENSDSTNIIKDLKNICLVKCKSNQIRMRMKSSPKPIFKFNRFISIGTHKNSWTVQSKVDAISFMVSEEIDLLGFLSFGPRNTKDTCTMKAEIKNGTESLVIEDSVLFENTDENNLVQFLLKKPIRILPDTLYEALFVITSEGLWNYGDGGKTETLCDGVTFKFSQSTYSYNGTNVKSGQIPGFIFTK